MLDETRRQQIESYLAKKWFGEGAGVGNLLPATAVTLSNGGALDLGGVNFQTIASLSSTDGAGSQILLGTAALTVGDATSTTFDGAVSGFGSLVKQGSGTLTLSGNNTYSGGTAVNDGIVKIGGRNQLPGTGGITLASGTTLMTDAANVANTQDISSTITLNGGTLAAGTGTPAQNFNGGNPVGPWGNYHLAPGASIHAGNNTTSIISAMLGVNGTGGYTPIQVDGGSTLHISGNITGVSYVSWGAFSKSGDGTLLLTGYNKATSQGMIVSAGTVEFSTNSLPTNLRANGGPAGYSADIQGNATLRWASGNTQDISFENGSSQIRIGDGVTATFDTNGNNVTLATAFDLGAGQTGALTKTGAGTLTLSAANSYTGPPPSTAARCASAMAPRPTNLADAADVIVAPGAMLHLDYSGTDQIDGLWVDGLQMPPGVYSSTSGFITGSGTLTVTTGPAANYAAWSGRGIHNLAGGPSDDGDNDTIPNLLEYVLGGNPRAASNGILPTATASSGNLVFTFRRIHSSTTDTTQVFQHGTDLSGWTDVPVVAGGMVAIQPDTPQAGTDTVTITVPAGTEPRIFGRLKVLRPAVTRINHPEPTPARMKSFRKRILALALALTASASMALPASAEETAAQRDTRMEWWREARFGMFIHWGLYAVPAGDYKASTSTGIGEWIMNTAKIPVAEYAQFAKQFNPVKFNADEWVAHRQGRRHEVHRHHRQTSRRLRHVRLQASSDSTSSTPRRSSATRSRNSPTPAKAGHQARRSITRRRRTGATRAVAAWRRPLGPGPGRQIRRVYLDKIAMPQVRELLANYGPAVLWWDTPSDMTPRATPRISAMSCKLQPGIIINNRLGGGVHGDTETPEQDIPANGFPGRDWETCMTMNDTWGYKTNDKTEVHRDPDPQPDRHRQQGRQLPAQRRSDRRGCNPQGADRTAEGTRRVDDGQWRGDLRHLRRALCPKRPPGAA